MGNLTFNINTESHIKLTSYLGSLHKSVLPVAIRETLNDVAFEAKIWIPKMASRKFITRSPAFFRAFTGVGRARGFDINRMESSVGVLSNKGGKGSRVAEGLEKQETGGSFRGRKLIPHDLGRISGSHEKKLSRRHRFDKIRITDARKKGKGKIDYLLIKKGGKGTVFELKSIGKKQVLKPVYSYRNTKTTRVEKTPFIAPASWIAMRKMNKIYVKRAKIQVERERKRNR